MVLRFNLFFGKELAPGFKVVGKIDLPLVDEKVGYIHLEFEAFYFEWKVAWVIR